MSGFSGIDITKMVDFMRLLRELKFKLMLLLDAR